MLGRHLSLRSWRGVWHAAGLAVPRGLTKGSIVQILDWGGRYRHLVVPLGVVLRVCLDHAVVARLQERRCMWSSPQEVQWDAVWAAKNSQMAFWPQDIMTERTLECAQAIVRHQPLPRKLPFAWDGTLAFAAQVRGFDYFCYIWKLLGNDPKVGNVVRYAIRDDDRRLLAHLVSTSRRVMGKGIEMWITYAVYKNNIWAAKYLLGQLPPNIVRGLFDAYVIPHHPELMSFYPK